MTSTGPGAGDEGNWTEIADRIWVGRFAWFDVNVVAVGGDEGLALIDTNSSGAAAHRTLTAVRRLSTAPVVAAINTHVHFDHTMGNAALRAAGAELISHEAAAAALLEHVAQTKRQVRAEGDGETDGETADRDTRRELLETEPVVPERTLSSALVLDLGERQIEILHPGKGHTDGDVVVRVPDADVLIAGDLIEESAARSGVPGFGEDCWPMEWPRSLDFITGMLGADSVVVPGHGAPVGLDFVHEQRAAIGVVAETIRDLASRGVPMAEALAVGDWPYPAEELAHAVARGYEQLPRGARQLPLI